MKRLLLLALLMLGTSVFSQSKTELIKHFEGYYNEMKLRGDLQGAINGLTHLDVLEPTQAKKDTIAFLYSSAGNHIQALNTIGIEKNAADSDIAVEVKATGLKNVGQPEKAIEHFEVMFSRNPSAPIAYELADLKTQLNNLTGAKTHIEYGLANVKEGQKSAFYEMQQPYQVSLKAAFLYLKALIVFNEDQVKNLDDAIGLLDQALQLEPNFNMAQISKDALMTKKK